MPSHRLWLPAVVISVAMLAAQCAPPVPAEYRDLYDELTTDLTAFQQTIDQSGDGSRWPDYQRYLDFYTQVAQQVRARGLTLVVETQERSSQGGFANWDVAPFYDSLTLAQYEQGRMEMARTAGLP